MVRTASAETEWRIETREMNSSSYNGIALPIAMKRVSPINNKDRINRAATALQPARIIYGDRNALLFRIAPRFACSRCQRTRDRAVSGRSFQRLKARGKSGASRRLVQARFSWERPRMG